MKAWKLKILLTMSLLLEACASDLSAPDNSVNFSLNGQGVLPICGIEYNCGGHDLTDTTQICLQPVISLIFDDIVIPYHEVDFNDNIQIVTTASNTVNLVNTPVSQSVVSGAIGQCQDTNTKSKLTISLAQTLQPGTEYTVVVNGQIQNHPSVTIDSQLSGIFSQAGAVALPQSFNFQTTTSTASTSSANAFQVTATSFGKILDSSALQASNYSFTNLLGNQLLNLSQNAPFVAYFSEPACLFASNCASNSVPGGNPYLNLAATDVSTFPGLSVFSMSASTNVSSYLQQMSGALSNGGSLATSLSGFQNQIPGSVSMIANGSELVFIPSMGYPGNDGSSLGNIIVFDIHGFMASSSSVAAPAMLPNGHTTVIAAQLNGVSWSSLPSFGNLLFQRSGGLSR